MNTQLFRLALEHLHPSDWVHFERLSSAFLASEYLSLRTMASPSGDGGRDSELFCPEGHSFIAAQYSVSKNWRDKIRHTVKRLAQEYREVRILLYLSSHQIGANADDLKKELLRHGIALDVRDQSWFIERASSDAMRESAAEDIIARIARPYLAGEKIINQSSSALSSKEARAALLYLGLQWQDDISGKGLTKLSFDALVRAALRHTDSETRLSRREIQEWVAGSVPSAKRATVDLYVDASLGRLTKRYIRHWQKDDEFCLTYDEQQRIMNRLAEMENEKSAFGADVARLVSAYAVHYDATTFPDWDDLSNRVSRVLEELLLKRGEFFVSAVASGSLTHIGLGDLTDLVMKDLAEYRPRKRGVHYLPHVLTGVIRDLLAEGSVSTQSYLTRLSNSYTLFAFLRETPDVQSATRKLFSHGIVWLDTTVLLPFLAEQLKDDPVERRLSRTFEACRRAGMELRVTSGIIEEIVSHMDISVKCSRYTDSRWDGDIPFLYHQFICTGRKAGEFQGWLELFRGDERAEEDIAQFLSEVAGIEREDLRSAEKRVDRDIRAAAKREWGEAHRRRRQGDDTDDTTQQILIRHDLETYLGVVGRRSAEAVSELGYDHWLLTFDSSAWRIRDLLRNEFGSRAPSSPLLSLSFLVNNLTFGPGRGFGGEKNGKGMPILLDVEMSESMPHDLLRVAEDVRRKHEGKPEHVIRRRVRDAIDKERHTGWEGQVDYG